MTFLFPKHFRAGNNNSMNMTEESVLKYLSLACGIFGEIANEVSHETFTILIILFNLAGIVELSKFVLTDVINYLFYYISIGLYKNLANSVEQSLNSKSNDQIEIWLAQHHFSNM
jgi:hypothetical protein